MDNTEYINKLSLEEKNKLKDFFCLFDSVCLMEDDDKNKLKLDFENAIIYYLKCDKKLNEILELLEIKKLGHFYNKNENSFKCFMLDDAAKLYPLSLQKNKMAIFRVSVYLKEIVVPELLQMALNFTIKRYPTFATSLKKGFFWHYLSSNIRHYEIEKEKTYPCQSFQIDDDSQLFKVLYFKNRISVEFFHGLTDGVGGITFLKTLIAEYLKLKSLKVENTFRILDADAFPNIEEYENAFAKVPKTLKSGGFITSKAVQMVGELSDVKPCKVLHFKIDANKIKLLARKYNVTVTAYILSIMFLAIKMSTDKIKGYIGIQVPVNMRKFYFPKTIRNFSMYCNIRLKVEEIIEFDDLVNKVNIQLKNKSSKEAMVNMVTATEKIVKYLSYIPIIIKKPLVKIVYGFLGDKVFSNTLSNLGDIQLPNFISENIENIDFVLGAGITNRAGCAVITVNNILNFSISKMTYDTTYEEKMYELLQKNGIDVEIIDNELNKINIKNS